MELFYSELIHLTVGLIIGSWLYYKYKERRLFFLCLFVSMFIDLDHLIDYFLYVDFSRFDLMEILTVGFFGSGKVYVFFHGWEFVLILLFLAYKIKKYQPILLTIALAVFGHLLVDQFTNGVLVFAYSFIYRLMNDFNLAAFKTNL